MTAGRLSSAQWLKIYLETLQGLWRAWVKRVFKEHAHLCIPKIQGRAEISPDHVRKIIRRCDTLINLLMFWKPGRCFYRSYTLALVLRKRGYPAYINIGCKNLGQGEGSTWGHAWITIEEVVYGEKGSIQHKFPVFLGSDGEALNYWTGPDEERRRPWYLRVFR